MDDDLRGALRFLLRASVRDQIERQVADMIQRQGGKYSRFMILHKMRESFTEAVLIWKETPDGQATDPADAALMVDLIREAFDELLQSAGN